MILNKIYSYFKIIISHFKNSVHLENFVAGFAATRVKQLPQTFAAARVLESLHKSRSRRQTAEDLLWL